MRDLLANRSRIPLRVSLEFGFATHPDSDDGALARLAAEVAGAGPPVDGWSYSNVAWCVLGRVIETATGACWEAAMREHLFEPLGMSATSFAPGVQGGSQASGYVAGPEGFRRIEPPRARAYGPAGTTVLSTAIDLLRFAAAHLADPALAVMRSGQSDVAILGWLDGRRLGWARFDWEGGRASGWDGLIGGERSSLRIVPERNLAIVLLANGNSGRAMQRSLLAELLPTLGMAAPPLRLDPVPRAAGDLARFAGTYAWPDRRVDVVAHAEGLHIREGDDELDARPLDRSSFVVDPSDPDNPTVTFADFDADGRPRVLYLMLWGLPRVDG